MTRAATARLIKSRSFHLFALFLFLAGCFTLSKNTVVIHEGADARLVTRVTKGLFLTNVRIGDRETGPFLIDTGSSTIILDFELAKGLNLSFRGESYDPVIKQKVKGARLTSLDVGPMTLQKIDVVVIDLSNPTNVLGERLAGVLGHPFFANAVVEVDYPRGVIASFDPKTYRLPRGDWQPLAFQDKRPIIAARLERNIEGQFILDTGNTSAVSFYSDFTRKHALLDNRKARKHKELRVDGLHDTLVAQIAWFEFAGRRFEQPIVQFEPTDTVKGRLELEGVAGVIGRGLLSSFTVVFNYSQSKIALIPK